jgi:hypothetical protein
VKRLAVLVLLAGLCAACTAQAEPATPATRLATAPPPVAAPAPAVATMSTKPPPPPPCARTVRACVSLSRRQAWLMLGGVADYGPVPIAHGAPAARTPTGTFPVSWKDKDNMSSVFGTPMPYSVFFAPGGIAFHQGDVRADSHGCVHLTPAAARVFFNRLRPGDLVRVVP